MDARFGLQPSDSPFAAKFSFSPAHGTLAVGEVKSIKVQLLSDILGSFTETFVWNISGTSAPIKLQFKGRITGPHYKVGGPSNAVHILHAPSHSLACWSMSRHIVGTYTMMGMCLMTFTIFKMPLPHTEHACVSHRLVHGSSRKSFGTCSTQSMQHASRPANVAVKHANQKRHARAG